jgi:RNA polymerase sigma-70 factor (ECF subfamily)
LKRRGLQNADAADIAQEVFRAVCQSIGDYEHRESNGSFRGWLLTVTRNKMLDHASRQRRQAVADGGTANLLMLGDQPISSAEEVLIEREYQRRLFESACQTVKQEFRELTWKAFWSTQVEQRPSREVAEELGVSVDAVYVARSRVVARLRQRIKELDSLS